MTPQESYSEAELMLADFEAMSPEERAEIDAEIKEILASPDCATKIPPEGPPVRNVKP